MNFLGRKRTQPGEVYDLPGGGKVMPEEADLMDIKLGRINDAAAESRAPVDTRVTVEDYRGYQEAARAEPPRRPDPLPQPDPVASADMVRPRPQPSEGSDRYDTAEIRRSRVVKGLSPPAEVESRIRTIASLTEDLMADVRGVFRQLEIQEDLSSAHADLQSRHELASLSLRDTTSRAAKLETENTDLLRRLRDLQARYEDVQKARDAYADRITVLNEEVQKSYLEVSRKQDALRREANLRMATEAKAKELADHLTAERAENSHRRALLEDTKAELRIHSAASVSLQERIDRLTSECHAARGAQTNAEHDRAQALEALSAASRSLEVHQQQISALSASFDTYREKAKDELHQKDIAIGGLISKSNFLEEQVRALREEKRALSVKVRMLLEEQEARISRSDDYAMRTGAE
ncbi:hypothetical protein [Chthonobacter rhizosphaerae]|uniref:hypothetical protein n=1 Tax=Chthonobacter rhizosphaerae TaxID=2735553 RepID=UPI0015EEA864|nr:hypothetical protein [Chthonobacter rhizosphaerae]